MPNALEAHIPHLHNYARGVARDRALLNAERAPDCLLPANLGEHRRGTVTSPEYDHVVVHADVTLQPKDWIGYGSEPVPDSAMGVLGMRT